MAKYSDSTITSIVTNAINDFNSIYAALKGKGVRTGGTTVLRDDTTGTTTAAYADLITNQLFTIAKPNNGTGVVDQPSSIAHTGGTIANFAGATVSLNNSAITSTYSGTTVTFTTNLLNAGYYGTNTVLQLELTGANLGVSGVLTGATNWTKLSGDSGNFVYTPAANSLISGVSITPAKIKTDAGNITLTSAANTLSSDITTNANSLEVQLTTPETPANYESFIVTTDSSVAGTFASTLSRTIVTKGYIEGSDQWDSTSSLTATKNLNTELDGTADTTIYIKKGTISMGSASGGDLSVTDAGDITVATVPSGQSANYYEIAVGMSAISFPNATLSEGYIKSTDAVNVSIGSQSISRYVKKGSVADSSKNIALEVTPESGVTVNAASGYTISVGVDNADKTITGTVTPGYITDTSYTTTLTGLSSTITLPKGAGTIADPTLTVSPKSGYSGYFGTNSTDGIKLDFVVDGTLTPTLTTPGYFKSGDNFTGKTLTSKGVGSLYIKKGAAGTYTGNLTITSNDASDGLTAVAQGENIFKTTVPESGDYYTLTPGITTSTAYTEGYITGAPTLNSGSAFYLPKAVLEWVDAGDDEEDYLQVTSGGYLPSGTISQISTGEIQNATVNAVLASSGMTIKSNASGSDYLITLSKGVIDAGYISKTNGTLQLSATYGIAHGSVNTVISTERPTFDVTDFTYNSSTGKYDTTITGTTTIGTASVTEGYVKSADVTTTGSTTSNTSTMSIDKVGMSVVGADLGTIDSALTTTLEVAPAGTTTAYAIEADLSLLSKTVTPKVSSDGYGATDDTGTAANVTGTGIIYLKQATIGTLSGSTTLGYTNNFSSSQSGDYTITVSNSNTSYSGSIQPGYMPSGTVSGTAISLVNNTVSVAHGSATVSSTNTASISNSGSVNFLASTTGLSAGEYTTLTASAVAALSKSSVTAGYMKDGDITLDNGSTGTQNYYLALLTRSSKVVGNNGGALDTESGVTVTEGASSSSQTVYTIDVDEQTYLYSKDKYALYNTQINIGADALGANAAADLDRLAQRLAGTLVLS